MRRRSWLIGSMVLASLALAAASPGPLRLRTEILPVDSVTLTEQEFLTVFLLDSFGGRGITQTSTDQSALVAYPGASHGFDSHLAPPSLWLPTVQRGPRCEIEERPGGLMVEVRTGQPFTLSHPCVERGATIGYHPDAHRQALDDVKAFLRSALLSP